jgi:hypothetical protein
MKKNKIKEIIKWFLPWGIIVFFSFVKSRHENKVFSSKGYNQISNVTNYDRYPEIFHYISYIYNTGISRPLKILSFGCSYGLECLSLRKYFPDAIITGFDINEDNIIKAKKLSYDDNMFFTSNWGKIIQIKFYDIILAMSVLCRWPQTQNVKNCEKIYSFYQFQTQIVQLDNLLKENGIFVIYNANFRFSDTSVYSKYECINIPKYNDSGFVTKYDKNNLKLESQNYPYSIFKKNNTYC